MHLRTILLSTLLLFIHALHAQVGVKAIQVVESEAIEMKSEADTRMPTPDGASADGDFDVPPTHPDCDGRSGQDRLDCTAELALALIRSRNGEPRMALAQWGSNKVTIHLSVNQFGEPKDVRLQQFGDPQLQRNVTTALHALPTLRPATKDGARTSSVLVLNYPYADLFAAP